MDTLFTIFKYAIFGFFGLIGFFIVIALIFGDRIVKKWEYEAEFRNKDGKEFGEFDIEMSRVEKKESQFSLKAKFHMRHEALKQYATVQIYLDQLLVLEGLVAQAGRIRLTKENLQNDVIEAQAGQMCRVVCAGNQLFAQEILPD